MFFPSGTVPSGPPIETRKALLLIDFQNDFLEGAGGKLPVPPITQFLDRLSSLATSFRPKGSIVFITTEFDDPRSAYCPELSSHNVLLRDSLSQSSVSTTQARRHRRGRSSTAGRSPDTEAFLRPGPDRDRACIPGTCGAQLVDILRDVFDPKEDVTIVKTHYSAFTDTQLLHKLRASMTQHLYIAGSLSNISVYATVIDAVRHGLEVTLIEDCLGYRDLECHNEAVKRMVDMMGAAGVDYAELMDDLAGLLGDVIHEEDFHSRFEVSIGPPVGRKASPLPPKRPVSSQQKKQRVEEWMTENDIGRKRGSVTLFEDSGMLQKLAGDGSTEHESSPTTRSRQDSPCTSPPRKRSTTTNNEVGKGASSKLCEKSTLRRTPSETSHRSNRTRTRLSKPASGQPLSPSSSRASRSPRRLQSSLSPSEAGHATRYLYKAPLISDTMEADDAVEASAELENIEALIASHSPPRCKKKKPRPPPLAGPTDIIGEGDSSIIANVVDYTTADTAFHTLKRTVDWQTMYHRTGEVPRLVAVQGVIDTTTNEEPIYRHPADESPTMRPFDDTVNTIRTAAEKIIGHPLNHVLIQYYRNGDDNISEHSDKTLDIVRGSSIVNVSLGAQRIMTLRTKKQPQASPTYAHPEEPQDRLTQRVPLMHNSLFVLGPLTNQHWLHGVRPDKRPDGEKCSEELAYDGERISLTFRQIGTFVNHKQGTIWGQGAKQKTRDEAGTVLTGQEAEREGEAEKMIRAFGQENHLSAEWGWEKWYGEGFDVVNFETTKAAG